MLMDKPRGDSMIDNENSERLDVLGSAFLLLLDVCVNVGMRERERGEDELLRLLLAMDWIASLHSA